MSAEFLGVRCQLIFSFLDKKYFHSAMGHGPWKLDHSHFYLDCALHGSFGMDHKTKKKKRRKVEKDRRNAGQPSPMR